MSNDASPDALFPNSYSPLAAAWVDAKLSRPGPEMREGGEFRISQTAVSAHSFGHQTHTALV